MLVSPLVSVCLGPDNVDQCRQAETVAVEDLFDQLSDIFAMDSSQMQITDAADTTAAFGPFGSGTLQAMADKASAVSSILEVQMHAPARNSSSAWLCVFLCVEGPREYSHICARTCACARSQRFFGSACSVRNPIRSRRFTPYVLYGKKLF